MTDHEWLLEAINLAHQCPDADTAFAVGAVIVDQHGNELARGHSRETHPHDHAEEAALNKIPGDPRLTGATIYSSLEPCAERSSRPQTCAQLIINAGITHVVIAWREPTNFVNHPQGILTLRTAGITVNEHPDIATPFHGQASG